MEGGGGAAATASAAGAKVFGGSRLKTLFGISKGGRPPPNPLTSVGLDATSRSRPNLKAYKSLLD